MSALGFLGGVFVGTLATVGALGYAANKRGLCFWQHDVEDFHREGAQPIARTPCMPLSWTIDLRARLLCEELRETLTALGAVDVVVTFGTIDTSRFDLVEVADGLADLAYVGVGTAVVCGIPLAAVWGEVHASNMAKFEDGILLNDAGKVIKPPGWTPPDVAGVLRAHGWEQ